MFILFIWKNKLYSKSQDLQTRALLKLMFFNLVKNTGQVIEGKNT